MVEVGDRCRLLDGEPVGCWPATPHLTELLLDDTLDIAPPATTTVTAGQHVTVMAPIGAALWLVEFAVAQQTWQCITASSRLIAA